MKYIFSSRRPIVFSSSIILFTALAGCGGSSPSSTDPLAVSDAGLQASSETVLVDGHAFKKKRQSTKTNTPPNAPTPDTGVTAPPAYLSANPSLSSASIDAASLQYMGTNRAPASINEAAGIPGNATDGLINFGKVADPDDPSRSAFLFQIAKRDPGTSKRTELAWGSGKGYSLGVTYWQAFRVRLGDNMKNAPAGDESIIWQVHDNSGEDLNPNISLIATGGGANAKLVAWLKYSASATPSLKANAVSRQVYTGSYPSSKWITFVVEFQLQYAANKGAFFKIWRDGQLVVNDTLPNDYNAGQDVDPSKRSYQKIGLYHYYDDQWVPGDYRTMHHKGIVTFQDNGTLTEPFMRNLIEAR